jgi:tryptophan synthase alpha chain
MSQLSDTLQSLRSRGEKAMGLFLTSGFPDLDSTLPTLRAIDDGGADFIELGMPFSDPLAEGKPIQRASARALSHGATMEHAFRTARQFRAESDTPLLLMGYLNPILRYGAEDFCRDAASSGVDGLILPDLPPEEGARVSDYAAGHGLNLVHLIAPNTADERIRRIDRQATGFVYAVSVTGLTGSELGEDGSVQEYLERARRLVTENPLLVGFGIRSHDDAMRMSRHTDGFIVGSALINRVEALWDASDPLSETECLEQVRNFARALKYG